MFLSIIICILTRIRGPAGPEILVLNNSRLVFTVIITISAMGNSVQSKCDCSFWGKERPENACGLENGALCPSRCGEFLFIMNLEQMVNCSGC